MDLSVIMLPPSIRWPGQAPRLPASCLVIRRRCLPALDRSAEAGAIALQHQPRPASSSIKSWPLPAPLKKSSIASGASIWNGTDEAARVSDATQV
jgi:hypothetical protein